MKLIVLDGAFDTLGVISMFNTLIWTPRYYQVGTFELHVPAELFDLLNQGCYLYRNDSTYLGVIREVNFAKDNKGARTAYCKGYFAEDLLNKRVIDRQQNLSGKPDAICRTLVERFFINPTDKWRKVAHVKLGEANSIGTSISVTATGDIVGEKLYKIEQTQEMSHRLVYDYQTNDLIFETWKGKDRTDSQTENSWAIFSDSFFNVKNAQYNRDSSSVKNFAYVAGEGEGNDRVIVEVDLRDSDYEERRELYVDARDLRKKYQTEAKEEKEYTADEYKKILYQRGVEKLAEYGVLETVNSDVDPNANLVYGVDFDLGDLCTYRYTDVNIECTKRITEVQEVFEGSKHTLSVVFGSEGATSVTSLIKREVS